MLRRSLMLVTLFAVLIGGSIPARAQDENKCFEKMGFWDAETETCTLSTALQMNIAYPMELVGNAVAEPAVDEYFRTYRSEFVASFAEYGTESYSPGPWSLDITYELYTYSDTIQSILFNVYTYMGGAHPNSDFDAFTFDTNQAKVLSLGDLFVADYDYLGAISVYAKTDLLARIGDMTDEQTLAYGTAPEPANFENFVLTPTSIIFFFPPYQMASYAAGPQNVEIPLSTFGGMLNPTLGEAMD